MIFKKHKDEVIEEIYWTISNSLREGLNLGQQPHEAIASAVAESFKILIDNQYTDEDFEQDITLKS